MVNEFALPWFLECDIKVGNGAGFIKCIVSFCAEGDIFKECIFGDWKYKLLQCVKFGNI